VYDVILVVVEASEAGVVIMAGPPLNANVSLVSGAVGGIIENAIADIILDVKADVPVVAVDNLVSDAAAIVAVADEKEAVVGVIVGFSPFIFVIVFKEFSKTLVSKEDIK
jgi:hypothetical protein